MSRYIIYLLFGLLLNITTAFQGNAQSRNNFSLSYFEDVDSKYSLESVKHEKFTSTEKTYVNLGITKSTLWLKVKLKKKNIGSTAVLVVKTPLKDDIKLSYVLKSGELIEESLGVKYPHSKNKFNHLVPAFEIPVTNLKSPIVFIKVQSRYSMKVPVFIKTKEAFYKERTTEYFLGGLLVGGLFLMGIYNLFLFFSTRDSSYLLYIIALFSAILSQGYLFGILIPYLSPDFPEFSFRFPIIIMSITGVFSSWFALQFLELKKTSRFLYYTLLVLISLLLFNIVLELLKVDYLSRKLNIILIVITSIAIFLSAVYSLIKGKKIALYFTIAWTFYLFGMITFALQSLDVLPYNSFTEHIMHFGTFLEVVLLSFALGHKYKLVRDEKERLEKQTREELEQLVKEQTKELETSLEEKKVLLKEVHHRVKNNLQIVISLLDLQVASIKDIKNKEIIAQSKSRVYSMSLIHQKLYQSNNLARVNMKNYLEELFIYIQNSYSEMSNKVTYICLIDNKELTITQAVPLGLIVNELLTNSFKYGLQNKENNTLKISLVFNKDTAVLEIADSGLGFEEKEQQQGVKKSLGLFLVKSLSKQLRATSVRYFASGLFITQITIPLEKNSLIKKK
ncbi:7TM diverse intracellular signaling domain-containing protein [Lacinutrix sp. Bg11-31]|uniref:7TM diverse intracellular signaling domain-containing protein n=1 Tax=Lacinutrix sp. Bg11-31 TaxID=2057808 RepID=UPI000C30B59B|nr:7TM diverse intracellular signaling domain-containing protein [Lacinutrix sp. Bg11-31]AUC83205.1 hypothetical protein CW733_14110 [Lacinutrix sp. Bg11-31]